MSQPPLRIRFGAFELDEDAFQLRRDGAPIAIEPKPLALLLHLARHRHRVVRRAELLEALWPGVVVSPDAVAHAMLKVREALGESAAESGAVRTVRGVGFRFVAEVLESASDLPAAAGIASAATSGARPSPLADPVLYGRAAELEILDGALASMLCGAARIVLIEGEAGIGKTAAAEALARTARAAGAEVHTATAWDGPGVPANWLWIQILRDFLARGEAAGIAATLGTGGADLARFSPELRERLDLPAPEVTDSNEARFRALDALARFLGAAARVVPRVVVLEDLHWADRASLRALAFVAAAVSRERVLLVCTARPDELGADHPLHDAIVDCDRTGSMTRVPFRGLSEDAIRELVQSMIGVSPPAEACDALLRRTAGNPFFIKQIVALARAGDPSLPHEALEGSLALPAVIPSGVRRVASQRLARLGERCREVLDVAVVIGREFPFAWLSRALPLDRETLLSALEEAVAAHVLEPARGAGREHRFVHDLLREVLYDELPARRRVEIHARVAEALEALHEGNLAPVVPALAHHYGEAAPLLESPKAVDYARYAGELARDALAYDDAALHFERGLRVLDLLPQPDPKRRAELLVCLGYAHQSAGRLQRGRELLREAAAVARRAGEAHALGMAASGLAELGVGSVDAEAIALLEESAKSFGETRSFVSVWVFGLLGVHLANQPGRIEEARAWVDRAEVASRSLEGPNALGVVLSARAAFLRIAPEGTPERRLGVIDEAIAHSGEHVVSELLARLQRFGALVELGDRAGAEDERARVDGVLGRVRSPYWRYVRPALAALGALLDGRFDEAGSLAHDAFGSGENPRFTAPNHAAMLLAIRLHRGGLAELVPMIALQAQRFPHLPPLEAALQLALIEANRESEARERLARVADRGLDAILGTESWGLTLAILGEVAIHLGALREVEAIAGILGPRGDHCLIVANGHYCHGPVAYHLSRLALALGDPDAAERHLETAFARSASLRSEVWSAHARVQQACLARRRGDERSARLVAEARRAVSALGLARLGRELDALPTRMPRRRS